MIRTAVSHLGQGCIFSMFMGMTRSFSSRFLRAFSSSSLRRCSSSNSFFLRCFSRIFCFITSCRLCSSSSMLRNGIRSGLPALPQH